LKKFYLLGCGKTTKAIATTFNIENIYDDREIQNDSQCIHSSKFPENLTDNDFLIPTPAIPPHHKIVKKFGNNIYSEYDIFALNNKIVYSIWVSGTNGKTTTTSMITHLLSDRGAVSGGNIGVPLGELPQNANIWVLETSSFSLHYSNIASPNLYVLLPISDDHKSWHGSFEEYEQSKLKPLKTIKEGEVAIIPDKYKNLDTNGYIISYKDAIDLANRFEININKIKFKGKFLLNAVLALATSKVLFDEVNYEKINSFIKAPHRQEEVLDQNGRIWINDSKATNPDSTLAFIEGFDRSKRLLLIIGGEDKDADWNEMFQIFSQLNIKLFSIGKSMNKVSGLAEKYNIFYINSENIQNAVIEISKEHDGINSVAVLSPASASFDQFKNYEDRGSQFRELVKNLKV
jgi:UDP-N-acetylmuramoylalanine--D-glutamate ligase